MSHRIGTSRTACVQTWTTRATLLAVTAGLSACSIFDTPFVAGVDGWEIACIPWGEYEESLPDNVCLWKQIQGGITDHNMAAACAQERNAFYGENKTAADYAYAQIWENNGNDGQCLTEAVGNLDAHPFPVTSIDEADPGVFNYIWCIPVDEVEITDGEGSYQVFLESGRCIDPDLTYQENCEELCEQWHASWPGYDSFTQGLDNGDCSVGNWSYSLDEDLECSALIVPGSILASSAVLSFNDTMNAIAVGGSGALIYDDTACVAGGTCEPGLFFKVEASTAGYTYADAAGSTYSIVLTGLELGVRHELQTQTDAASGALVIPTFEVYLGSDDLSVDGVSFGALEAHERMHDATVVHDPTRNVLIISGGIPVPALGGATVDVVIEADFGSPMRAWPWSAG